MNVLAIDIGSSSARIMLVDNNFVIKELYRVSHSAVMDNDGRFRWDIDTLFAKLIEGLDNAVATNDIVSIGICSWGVDYGVVGENGKLLDSPYCYRDERNIVAFEKLYSKVDKYSLFEYNGIYPLAINTAYQLLADKEENRYHGEKVKIVMIADMLAYRLTGRLFAEITNASTTQLLCKQGNDWDYELISKLGLDRDIFPPIIKTGDCYGTYKGIKVLAVGTHDTASAIYAMGNMEETDAFLSSGSWLLLGKVVANPIISRNVFNIGYTNERVCQGKVSLLNNLNGLYIIQRIVAETGVSYYDIDANIENASILGLLDTDRLNSPSGMLEEICEILGVTEYNIYDIAKTVYYSLAVRVSRALDDLRAVTNSEINRIIMTGGATKAKYLLSQIEELCKVEIVSLAGEGAVLGNGMFQMKQL